MLGGCCRGRWLERGARVDEACRAEGPGAGRPCADSQCEGSWSDSGIQLHALWSLLEILSLPLPLPLSRLLSLK